MRHPVIKSVGYVLLALIGLGIALIALSAARSGHAFYGTSYYSLDLGSYSTLAAIALIVLIGLVWSVHRVLRLVQRWRRSAADGR